MATDPRFKMPLLLEYLDGGSYKLIGEFDYHTDVWPLTVVKVPEGFETDFASIPRIFWNILPPTGRYGKAAVVHDFLYRTPGQATKSEADDVFLEAMTALGVGFFTRQTMYRGVQVFGRRAYKGGL